jgi:hypothetical protein
VGHAAPLASGDHAYNLHCSPIAHSAFAVQLQLLSRWGALSWKLARGNGNFRYADQSCSVRDYPGKSTAERTTAFRGFGFVTTDKPAP